VQHVISRFVDREFRLDVRGGREEYLRRAEPILGRCDWLALAFALMSSHVHWALRAGRHPSAAIFKPLHVGFAGWLNAAEGRLGPVFAERHRSLTFEADNASPLVAYIHNNPVRAQVVQDPADSSWTSHRAYLGLAPAPPWLNVELGLHLCGFSATPSGRLAFHEMVCSHMHAPKSATLSATELQRHRRRAREQQGAPVEVGTPTASAQLESTRLHVPVIVPPDCSVRPRWSGAPARVLEDIERLTGVGSAEIRSRSRRRRVTRARRLALLVWTSELHRPAIEMARALGLSSSSASGLTSNATPADRQAAAALAPQIRLDRE
jgi:hypothetical protein